VELTPRSEQRVVAVWEGNTVDDDEREGATRDVDPLEESRRGEQTGGFVEGELAQKSRSLILVLGEDRIREARP
jgi:hypothetical protein